MIKKQDSIAIVSPSSAAAAIFPWVFEQGLERLKTVFGLKPVIMPHCLNAKATQEDKASDLHEAFMNPEIKAVIASIGGIDQIRMIPYLKASVFRKNPKPFFGYSDNTHLCSFLFQNGIPSFYGGSIMTQFAMQSSMCPETVESLEWALFNSKKSFALTSPSYCLDESHPWDDKSLLTTPRKEVKNEEGLLFDGSQIAEGTLWGGCLESLADLMRVPSRVPKDFSKMVLFLETSEEMPSTEFVRRFVVSLGEAGILSSIRGLIVGRPQSWFFDKPLDIESRLAYRKEQRDAVLSVLRSYNKSVPVVLNACIGHSDPQLILPYGGQVTIDPKKNEMVVRI